MEVAACCAWALLYSWLGIEADLWTVETRRQFNFYFVIVLALHFELVLVSFSSSVWSAGRLPAFYTVHGVPSVRTVVCMSHERASALQHWFAVPSG
jgi:hypothetical protein